MDLNIEKIRKYGKLATLIAIIQLLLMVLNGYAFGMVLFNLSVTAALTHWVRSYLDRQPPVIVVLRTQQRINENMANTTILVTIMEDIG